MTVPNFGGIGFGAVAGQVANMRVCDIIGYGYELDLNSYPIWDESKRDWLNGRILNHFWLREIACETPAEFNFYLTRKMHEVMPWLNVVFESNASLKTHEDLLNNEEINVERTNHVHSVGNVETDGTGSTDGTLASTTGSTTNATSTGTNSANAKSYNSNDPSVSMVGQNETSYYNTGTVSESSGTAGETGTTTVSGSTNDTTHSAETTHSETDDTRDTNGSDTEHRKGHYGRTLTGAISEYMESYSNSLQILFKELEPLFSQVFAVPDTEFTPGFIGPGYCVRGGIW